MRIIILIAFVAAAAGIVYWQAPTWLPPEALAAGNAAGLPAIAPTAQMLVASIGSGEAVLPAWAAALSGVAFVGLIGYSVFRRRGTALHSASEPEWISAARALAAETGHAKDYLRQCDAIAQKLVPDIEHRGRAALARAHQLDLYWRFVGRNRTSKTGRPEGPEYQRWLATTRIALKAVAVSPEGRFMPAFQEIKPAIAVVGGAAAATVNGFYKRLGEHFAEYDAAWALAHGELGRAEVNRDAVLAAIEKLRRLNRAIAEDAARLVGPLEIYIRAVN